MALKKPSELFGKKGDNSKISENINGNLNNIKQQFDKVEELISSLNALIEKYSYPVIFSTHPRTRKQLDKLKIKPNSKIQFMNPDNRDGISSYRSDTHFTDIMIGVTDRKPSVTGANTLLGWSNTEVPWKDYGNVSGNYVGQGNTSILPNNEILFGEHTHSHAGLNEDGFETGESWAPRSPQFRMGIDSRIPSVANPGGG